MIEVDASSHGPGIPPTIAWKAGCARIIDQRDLPGKLKFLDIATPEDMVAAIDSLAIRGAPALELAGAFGVALAVNHNLEVPAWADKLRAVRPTAVNLARGVDRAQAAWTLGQDVASLCDAMFEEDRSRNELIATRGADLIELLCPEGDLMTICNAGSLACGSVGTQLGIISKLAERRHTHVWVCETRPLKQGSRLTAWELTQLNIPHTVIVDSTAGHVMRTHKLGAVITGADRIARNGDVANKIGTYQLAILARHHNLPFAVAAPTSTVDADIATGDEIKIEIRSPLEITDKADAINYAFDVTPYHLISTIITERGPTAPWDVQLTL